VDRTTLQYTLVALLGSLAVVLAAATLPTATRPAGEAGPGGDGDGDGSFISPPSEEAPAGTLGGSVPFLTEVLGVLALVAILALVWYLYRDFRAVVRLALGIAVLAGVVILLSRTLQFVREPRDIAIPVEFGNESGLGGGNGNGELTTTDPVVPSVLLFVLFGALLVGAFVVVRRHRRDSDETAVRSPDTTEDTETLGEVAGSIADRLDDDGSFENEIYRAWVEMTALFDLSRPETKTPGEFATLATDAGMDPHDVRELTVLFERVRYGTADPSERDEQRAVSLFRRLESTYAEGGSTRRDGVDGQSIRRDRTSTARDEQ